MIISVVQKMYEKKLPSNWSLLVHILRLYKDLNQLIQLINEMNDKNEIKSTLRRIIGRLKILNTLGSHISWRFLAYIPINILILNKESLKKPHVLRRYLLHLRNSIEKMVAGKAGIRLLRRKDAYISLRHPGTGLSVPSNFEQIIPGYEYIQGTRPILLTAAHAALPGSDAKTSSLVKRVASKTQSHALISKIPRLYLDANRLVGRILPFRRRLEYLIETKRIKLLIDIHGMERKNNYMVDVGTWFGFSATKNYIQQLLNIFEQFNISYNISTKFYGGDIIFYHANKPWVNAIQLEISSDVRGRSLRLISKALICYINQIGEKYGSRKAD